MEFHLRLAYSLLCCISTVGSTLSLAQRQTGASGATGRSQAVPAQVRTDPAGVAAAQAISAAAAKPDEVQGDYIPCKFTLGQLRALVAPEIAATLSAAEAESLKQRVIAAATTTGSDAKLSGSPLYGFVSAIAGENFTGLTPGEALNVVLRDLALWMGGPAPATPGDVARGAAKLDATLARTVSGPILDEARKIVVYLSSQLSALVAKSQMEDTAKGNTKGPTSREIYQSLEKEFAAYPRKSAAQPEAPAAVRIALAAVQKALDDLADEERIDTAQLPAAASILDAARKGLSIFQRPPDVGCSMSILGSKETTQAFGHMIANQYIAVEVVVRNLNRDHEFALHDVEFEVNADPTGRLGRFFSGRDKVIVRALSSAQSSFDPRNIAVHSAQGLGMIMSTAAPIFLPGEGLANAAAVFNGAFVTGFDRYWKDLSTDQLNLLNDVGFSSSQNAQTVVPKGSTSMFVTFIPAQPFEEGWWTQPCAEIQYLGSTDSNGRLLNLSRSLGADEQTPDPATTDSAKNGIDVAQSLETCLFTKPPARSERHWYRLYTKTQDGGVFTQSQSDPHSDLLGSALYKKDVDLFRNAYRVPYKKWSPRSTAIFAQLSNTVVAGMHLVEDQQLQATVAEVKCAKDSVGNWQVDPAQATFSCPITGKNLNQLAKLRLRNNADVTDSNTGEGAVQVVGDSSNATVFFKVTDLLKLNAQVYDVFGVTLNGVEQKTTQTARFSLAPVVMSIDPTTFGKTPVTLTLRGYRLGNVLSITLAGAKDETKKGPQPTWAVTTPSGATDPNVSSITVSVNMPGGKNKADGMVEGDFTFTATDASKQTVKQAPSTITYKP